MRAQDRAIAAAENEATAIRERVAVFLAAAAAQQQEAQALNTRLQAFRTLAGMTAVGGPGVIGDMDDSSQPRRPNDGPNEAILHNRDVASVVNELGRQAPRRLPSTGSASWSLPEWRAPIM